MTDEDGRVQTAVGQRTGPRGPGREDVAALLADVVGACRAIAGHVACDAVPTELVVDAVRMRLVEIGVAVRSLPPGVVAPEPDIPWSRIARLGEPLALPCDEVTAAMVLETARGDVPGLLAAAERLRTRLRADTGEAGRRVPG